MAQQETQPTISVKDLAAKFNWERVTGDEESLQRSWSPQKPIDRGWS